MRGVCRYERYGENVVHISPKDFDALLCTPSSFRVAALSNPFMYLHCTAAGWRLGPGLLSRSHALEFCLMVCT